MPSKRPRAPKKPPTETPEELIMLITINQDLEILDGPWDYLYTDADPLKLLWFFLYIVRHAERGGIQFAAKLRSEQHRDDLMEHMRRARRLISEKTVRNVTELGR